MHNHKPLAVAAAKATGVKGAVGAVLRRENLYSSLITDWRKQRDTGALAGLQAAKIGRPAKDRTVSQLADSRWRVNELESELAAARELIKAQGKVSACDITRWNDSVEEVSSSWGKRWRRELPPRSVLG